MYYILLTLKSSRKASLWQDVLVCFPVSANYILYLLTLYIYCVYPAMSKSPKQEPSCLKIAETSIIIIFFKGVLYAVHHLYCYDFLLSLYMNQIPERKALLGTWRNNTEVYLNPFISTQNHIIARSSTNKTDRHDITEILLNVALNTMNQPTNHNCRINWNIVERSIKHQ